MDDLVKIITTGVVSLAGGYFLKFLEPASKVVWWSAHAFSFETDPTQKSTVWTHAFTIQNIGRKVASEIEIVHRAKPELFKLNPSLDFTEHITPDGQHVIRIASLAPKEWFSIEFLSLHEIPALLYIRTKDGHAEGIPIQFQRIYPPWYLTILKGFVLIGLGFSLYWFIRAGLFISSHF